MKTRALAMSLLFALAATPALALAQASPPANAAAPGLLRIDVDARDLARRIFKVTATVPAKPGPMTLLYPQWIPGNHSPTGPIDKLAGLRVTANGKPLAWQRDQFNVYAFKVDVPEGVSEIVAHFDFLSSQGGSQGRVVMTPEMLNLQWNANSLYPAGVDARQLQAQASVTLPKGWSFATALETARREGDTVVFKPISYDHLVDSPLFAGEHYQRIDLDPGAKVPVHLNVFADDAKSLKPTDAQIKLHRALVQQADKLYGARHYNHYEFLLALTDRLGGIGLEHHRSSENSAEPGYFTEWDKSAWMRDLLPHEYTHSWNGKYRRGADLATASFNVPMGDSLLWVYEGQTQFWGQVLAARSGLWSVEQARDMLANVAATYDRGRPGLAWRPLQDTTNDPTIAQRRTLPYRNYQMSEDYYSGGQMLWLEVEGKLRELSGNRRSLDDFARAFFGVGNGDWDVNPYTFDDVVATLNGIAPYDWATFLRGRLDGHGPLTGGLALAGWKLVYRDTPNAAYKAQEKRAKGALLAYSLGATVLDSGTVGDVIWDSPAFNAVRIGVPEDFVNAQTTRMLAAFSRRHPQVKMEISSGLSRDLAHGFDHGELDLVLVKQRRNTRQAVHCRREPMHWIDSLRSSCLQLDPLPLVTFPPRGLYRDEMIHAVEALGLRWRIAFTSSSLSGIQGAVADGIGISLLPRRAVMREHRIIDGERDLPVIDNYEIGLLHRADADDAVRALAGELWRQVQREPD